MGIRTRFIGRRRMPVIALAVAMLVVIPAVLLATQQPSAAGSTVLTIFTAGASVARGSADFATASDGAVLAAGDRVRTDDSGHALVTFFDGSTLEIEPATTVTIDTARTNGDGSTAIQMTQTLGRTWASVQKLTRADSRFEIRTPSSTAAVRGTAFLTEVLSNGDTTVQTTEGTVAVSAQGQTVLVTAGQTTTVQNRQAPAAPSSMPAPSNTLRFGMHSPAHVLVFDPLGRACGIAMPGATIVRQIPGCAVSDPASEPQTIDVPNAAGGTYRATIVSIDPGGPFTLTATGLDRAGSVSFDLSLAGDGRPGMVFGSSVAVTVAADGALSASGLAPLVVVQGPTPSPSPVTTTSAPTPAAATPSFVPSFALPKLPVATSTPTPTPTATPSPTPTATPSPTPTASPSPSPTATLSPTPPTITFAPTPTPTATSAPTPTPTPAQTQCIDPSRGNGNCDQHK